MQAYKCDDCGELIAGPPPTVDGAGVPSELDVKVKMRDFQVASRDTVMVRVTLARPSTDESEKCPTVDLCSVCRALAVLRTGLEMATMTGLRKDCLVGLKREIDHLAKKEARA